MAINVCEPARRSVRRRGATVGCWLMTLKLYGFELSAFFLERDSTHFKAVSDGTVLLARPYIIRRQPGQRIIAGLAPPVRAPANSVGYSRIDCWRGGQPDGESASLRRVQLDFLTGAVFLQNAPTAPT